MELGIYLPSAGPFARPDELLAVARAADDNGWDSVWMPDHLFTPTKLESSYPYSESGTYFVTPEMPFYDPLALFGVLAAATRRVKIGVGVLVAAYRHPLVVAKALATVEQFAPGRILLGLGAGWMKEEFDAVGVPYERRGARLVDYIGALRAAWAGEPRGYDGEFYSWVEGGFLPAPTTPIPIILGGHGDAALRRAARLADGWAVITKGSQGGVLDEVRERVGVLNEQLASEGRAQGFQLVFQTPLWISERANPRHPLTGPPQAIAESLHALEDIGLTSVSCIVAGDAGLIRSVMQRFDEEVRPLL